MTEPLYVLRHEHRVIEKALRALDGVGVRLQCGQHVPAEVLSQLVDFISAFACGYHHRKEETYLFPLLEKQGVVREGGPLAVISDEHRIESELTAEMQRAINRYRDLDPEAKQLFVVAARRYVNHLIGHIEKEDRILLTLAAEMLDEDAKASLKADFGRAESEFGAAAKKKYEEIASVLERVWAL